MAARKAPKPKPAAAEALGKRGPKPDRSPPVVPLAGRPDPPDFIRDDALAAHHWRETLALIEQAGLLSRVDHDALAIYCSLWSAWREAERQVPLTGGAIITLPNRFLQANPWKTLAIGYQKEMKPYLDMFGMTPKSRSKLKLPEAPKPNAKWEGFDPEGDG